MKIKNTIEIVSCSNRKVIRKTHRTKFYYAREYSVISLLNDSDINHGKILNQAEDYLDLEFIEGKVAVDLLTELEQQNNLQKGIEIIDLIINWLVKYYNFTYKKTGVTLLKGDVNLKNFIIADNNTIYGIDFEEAICGNYTDEIAEFVCFLLNYYPGNTKYKKALSKHFIENMSSKMNILVSDIENSLKNQLNILENRRFLKNHKISIAILSGGRATRMNGRSKGCLDIGKATFLDRLIGEFCWADELILSIANKEQFSLDYPISLIYDEYPQIGPLGGITTVLKHSKNNYVFFTPCDSPLVTTKTAQMLFTIAIQEDLDAVVAVDEQGRYNPLCGVYNKRILPCAEKLIDVGIYKIAALFEDAKIKKVQIESKELLNVNTPEEYEIFVQNHKEFFL